MQEEKSRGRRIGQREREREQETPHNKKTWPATSDRAVEKDSSESWGPRWLLPWYSPRRWLLSPKNGSAPLLGRPVEINLSGAPSFLSLVLPAPFTCSGLHIETHIKHTEQGIAAELKHALNC